MDKLIVFLREISAQTFDGHQALSKLQTLKIYSSWNFESKHNELNTLLFGTFDYMRAELEVVYSGEQFWVNSFDNSKIDCMVIPSAIKHDHKSGMADDNLFGGVVSH